MLQDLPELEVPVEGQLEEKLGLEPLPEFNGLGLCGIEVDGELPIQLPFQGVLKTDDLLLLGRREQVRLGEQEDDPRGVLRVSSRMSWRSFSDCL